MTRMQLVNKISQIQQMSLSEVVEMKNNVQTSDARYEIKRAIMEAIEVRLSENKRASEAMIEYSDFEDVE